MDYELPLPALTPENPCSYLAALGLLRLAAGHEQLGQVGLSWSGSAANESATLHVARQQTLEELGELLAANHGDVWLPDCGKDIRKLTPEKWKETGSSSWIGRPDHLDKNGEILPTGWRTYTIKEKVGWLEAVRVVAKETDGSEKWLEALRGPWMQSDKVSPLGLEPSSYQDAARQASDLSTVKPLATAGLVWLAINAFPLFPVLPGVKRPLTAGLFDGDFIYATWSEPLPLSMVSVMCRIRWSNVKRSNFTPYGIRTFWRSAITRTATDRRQLGLAYPI